MMAAAEGPGMAQVGSGAGTGPARREARLVAFAVDGLLLALGLGLFLALGGLTVLLQTNWLEVDPSGGEWRWGYVVAGLGLGLGLPPLYFGLGALWGGTAGARLLGLTVQRRDGASVGAGRALARAALLCVTLLPLGVGALASLVDREGRPLHDRWAGTVVVESGAVGR